MLKRLIKFDFMLSSICISFYSGHCIVFSLLGMLLTPRGVCSLCEDLTNPGADVDLAQWADGSPYYGINDKNISYLPANAFTNIYKESILRVSMLYIATS